MSRISEYEVNDMISCLESGQSPNPVYLSNLFDALGGTNSYAFSNMPMQCQAIYLFLLLIRQQGF